MRDLTMPAGLSPMARVYVVLWAYLDEMIDDDDPGSADAIRDAMEAVWGSLSDGDQLAANGAIIAMTEAR